MPTETKIISPKTSDVFVFLRYENLRVKFKARNIHT